MSDWVRLESGLVVPEAVATQPRPAYAVDLFCGCGGFSLGIISSGFHVLAGADADPSAAVTYLVNLGAYPVDIRFVEESDRVALEKLLRKSMREEEGVVTLDVCSGGARKAWVEQLCGDEEDPAAWPDGYPGVPVFFLGDIRKLKGADILDAIGLERGELDLVVGGPPCQGFSRANRRRHVADPRNNLTFDFARLVVEMQPRAVCMENVPEILAMVTPEGQPVMDEVCRILERGEYGEFESLRRILSDDPGRRIVKKPSPPRAPAKEKRAPGAQADLFEVRR